VLNLSLQPAFGARGPWGRGAEARFDFLMWMLMGMGI